MSITAAATSAQAQFLDFLGYVKKGYDFADKFILNHDPSDLVQMKAALNQAKTEIIAELDDLAAAWDSSCAANAVDTFQNIDQLTPDNLQAFAISSDKCVTDAQAQIGVVRTGAAIDKIGFALNTVGPIALLANAHAGFPTDALKQHIMEANRQLQRSLTPTCDVSILDPANLPSFGQGRMSGHGACYNYTVATPPRVAVGERGGVFYLPDGPGRAFLPWGVLGHAVPDDDLLPWRGYTVAFPPFQDFSIAISQVMQGTSWQIAGAVLDRLLPTSGPIGSPVALTVSTDTVDMPIDVFWRSGDDNVFRGVLVPFPDASNPTFSGWDQMDGALRSVAAVANADGRVEMFGISRIGGIFHRWQQFAGNESSWSPWAQMDGQLNSITVARNQDGTLQVFGTNPFGNIWTRNQILGGDQVETERPPQPMPAIDAWTRWKQMDGVLSQVAAVTDTDGQIHLYGINSAGMLFHRQQTAPNAIDPSVSGAWTDWDQVQNPGLVVVIDPAPIRPSLVSRPTEWPLRSIAATTDVGGRVNIFGITGDDRLFQRVKVGVENVYTDWSPILDSMRNVAAIKEGGGQGELVLVGIDANGNTYRNTFDGVMWKGWVPLTAVTVTVPNVIGVNVARATGTLRSAGLGNSQDEIVDVDCIKPVGTVTEQTPRAGTQVSTGFVVYLQVEAWPTGRNACRNRP
jgi:hypothetical protein